MVFMTLMLFNIVNEFLSFESIFVLINNLIRD